MDPFTRFSEEKFYEGTLDYIVQPTVKHGTDLDKHDLCSYLYSQSARRLSAKLSRGTLRIRRLGAIIRSRTIANFAFFRVCPNSSKPGISEATYSRGGRLMALRHAWFRRSTSRLVGNLSMLLDTQQKMNLSKPTDRLVQYHQRN